MNKNPLKKLFIEYGDEKQITILDQRFYRRNKNHYPSVTYILSYFPKGKFFEEWLKESGSNAKYIMEKAAEEGTQVHESVEDYVKGKEIVWIEEDGQVNYPLNVWQMIVRFQDFWTTFTPKLIAIETHTFSDKYKYAGTIDLVVEIGEEVWLIDVKTSNMIPISYHLQTAAYQQAWSECYDRKIHKRGILWLKAKTRGPRKDHIQGEKWNLIESSHSFEDDLKSFQSTYDLFRLHNPKLEPYTTKYPTSIKL